MIKMLASTYYDGKQYRQGETYSIDEKTKKRWIKNGIAEVAREPQSFSSAIPGEESPDYNSMEDAELAELASGRKIDISGKTRRQVINMLRKAEEV